MQYCILLFMAFNQTGDTLVKLPAEKSKSYSTQIITNTAIGLGFGIGAGAFYLLGNKAYDNYQRSGSMKAANEYYNQAVMYDNARNICFVGTVFFLVRAVYYQLKSNQSSKAADMGSIIDIDMPEYAKVKLGFKARL